MRKHTPILVLIIGIMVLSACGQSTQKDSGYGDLRDFLPTNEDLIAAGLQFSLTKKGDTSETTNEEMMKSEYYDETDDALIFDLGRETGWSRGFIDNNTDELSVICEITSYSNQENAKLAVEQYNPAEVDELEQFAFHKYIQSHLDIGDTSVMYEDLVDNLYIEFSVNRFGGKVWVIGTQDLKVGEAFARIMFEKITKSALTISTDSQSTLAITNTPDTRVYDNSVEEFLPTSGDISGTGYKNWRSDIGWVEYTNDMWMSSSDYDAERQAEITEFGRVTEFFQFLSNNSNSREEAIIRLIIYENNEGAKKAWNNSKGTIELIGEDIKKTFEVGDICISYSWSTEDINYYNVEFLHKNVKAEIIISDSQRDAQLINIAEDFARLLFEKIQSAIR